MKRFACLATAALSLATLTGPAAASRGLPGVEAANEVVLRIKAGDCAGAAARLDARLASDNYPEVNLLAGSMFEHGICLKPNWDHAVTFYIKAFDGGQRAAAHRLMAGFAAPEHGPDMAAALWWANRPNNEFSVKDCHVSEAVRNDPDRFVEELRAWPQARLAMCNYMVGVLATISGEIRYPEKALRFNLGGDFKLRFAPAVPRVDIKSAQTKEYQTLGWVDGKALDGQKSRSVKGTFEDAIRQSADRALKRYAQPAGIPPDTAAEMQFVFQLQE